MGRELKRVPLSFNWPLSKTWGGFLNPFGGLSESCPVCGGSGYSPEAKLLEDQWYGYAPFKPEDRGSRPWTPEDAPVHAFAERNCSRTPDFYGNKEADIQREAQRLCNLFNGNWCYHLNADDVAALVKEGRLHNFTSVFTPDEGWKLKDPPYVPTPEEVNAESIGGMGHDSINNWVCVKAECDRLGVSSTCSHCKGECSLWPSPEAKQQYENWEREEPPSGEGYQLWETVSEGSPISPVFSTPEELAEWLASPAYGRKVDQGMSKENWLAFITGPGWAPSFVAIGGHLMSGVEAISSP